MSRYDTPLTQFQRIKVIHDARRNTLQVRFPYFLNSTNRQDKQILAILLHNKFEYWQKTGWVGPYSEANLKHLERIERIMEPKTGATHG